MRTYILAVLLAATSAVGHAHATGAQAGGWEVRQPSRFIVSAVLSKNDSPSIIKPVHGVVPAESESDAIVRYVETVSKAFPGYAIVSTLASRVPEVGSCEKRI